MPAKEKTAAPLSATDPAAALAGFQAALSAAQTDFPAAPEQNPDTVELPGGLVRDGERITYATVRELTGEDEEKIFRALMSRNAFHVRNTILECGTVRVGTLPPAETLKDLLLGDLDALLLGTYKMTYGDHIDIRGWRCPLCGDPEDIGLDIAEDIPVRKLARIEDARFEVELRNGSAAVVRLPTGADQAAAGENPDLTLVERNTLILQRCIEQVTDPGGMVRVLAAFPNFARQMGIKDRRKVLQEIADRQPGPQYMDIKFTHNSCGKEVRLALDLADLFLG